MQNSICDGSCMIDKKSIVTASNNSHLEDIALNETPFSVSKSGTEGRNRQAYYFAKNLGTIGHYISSYTKPGAAISLGKMAEGFYSVIFCVLVAIVSRWSVSLSPYSGE